MINVKSTWLLARDATDERDEANPTDDHDQTDERARWFLRESDVTGMGDLIALRDLAAAGALIADGVTGLRGCNAVLVGLVTLCAGTTGFRSMTEICGMMSDERKLGCYLFWRELPGLSSAEDAWDEG